MKSTFGCPQALTVNCKNFIIAGTCSILSLVALSVSAATFTVTNFNDTGAGSLRAAIADANGQSGTDTIDFDSSLNGGTISLSAAQGEISITDDVIIRGPGADLLTISGLSATRIFSIVDSNVQIEGLTLDRGRVTGGSGGAIISTENDRQLTLSDCAITRSQSDGFGGGVLAEGTVIIDNCRIENNSSIYEVNFAYNGGGISANILEIKNSSVINNLIDGSNGQGGGLYAANGATIENTRIAENQAISDNGTADGGGAYIRNGAVVIRSSTFENNQASDWAGALYPGVTRGGTNTTLILDSTFSGNEAAEGGAVFVTGPTDWVAIVQTTLSGNSATTSGGGVYSRNRKLFFVASSTIIGNSAGQSGGGIYIQDAIDNEVIFQNSYIANNTSSGNGADVFMENQSDINTPDSRNNFIGDSDTTGFIDGANGNIVNVTTAQVGPLQNNGGPTQTHEPLPGSRIVDAGNNQLVTNILQIIPGLIIDFDQRGFPRIDGGTVDIGSVELPILIFRDGFE